MRENHIGKETLILHQFDPDPFYIFMVILGAVGSFASIIAYIESEIEQHTQEREAKKKTQRELADLLIELEAEYTELTGLLQGLEAILHRGIPLSKFPFEFGGYKQLFVDESFTRYVETLLAVNRKTAQLIELTSKILQRFYTYQVRISSRLLEELVKFRVDLNLLLKGLPNYEDAFHSYYRIISKGEFLIRELKKSLREREVNFT